MEINVSSYRAMVKQLCSIDEKLGRIAEVLETFVRETLPMGYARQGEFTKEQREVEISYVDEEAEIINEIRVAMGKPRVEEE